MKKILIITFVMMFALGIANSFPNHQSTSVNPWYCIIDGHQYALSDRPHLQETEIKLCTKFGGKLAVGFNDGGSV